MPNADCCSSIQVLQLFGPSTLCSTVKEVWPSWCAPLCCARARCSCGSVAAMTHAAIVRMMAGYCNCPSHGTATTLALWQFISLAATAAAAAMIRQRLQPLVLQQEQVLLM